MAAGFSMLRTPEEIDETTHEIFVTRRAFKRLTLPRYALLDHKVLDRSLFAAYGSVSIEDVWKPYFAVATDLSNYAMRVIRAGPIWQAVRASCAIPGVLPPFFDDEGCMLVDGGVVDNVPVAAMHALKTGPNLVVDLRPPKRRLYNLSYQSIPGRGELFVKLINPLSRGSLSRCPGPASVIQRSIFGNIRDRPLSSHPLDLVLRPPPFAGSSFMNWTRHREVFAAAYAWGVATIEALDTQGDPAFAALKQASQPL
jgi:NTE family protein